MSPYLPLSAQFGPWDDDYLAAPAEDGANFDDCLFYDTLVRFFSPDGTYADTPLELCISGCGLNPDNLTSRLEHEIRATSPLGFEILDFSLV